MADGGIGLGQGRAIVNLGTAGGHNSLSSMERPRPVMMRACSPRSRCGRVTPQEWAMLSSSECLMLAAREQVSHP